MRLAPMLAAASLAALSLLPPAAGLVLPEPPQAAVPVAGVGNAFLAPVLVIPAGTTVEWDQVLLHHTVTTTDDLASGGVPLSPVANDPGNADGDPDTFDVDLAAGPFAHTFVTPGTYQYYCRIHVLLGMVGVVQVV